MPEFTITHKALYNLAQHCTQEARYFEQESEPDHQTEFEALAEHFDEAASSGVREITLRIMG